MKRASAGLVGGLIAGLAMSLVMGLGRRAGILHKTLAENAEDWLDRAADTRRRIGEGGTRAMEQANHMAAAAVFGVGYALLRERVPALPAWVLGTLYGSGLYATNIAGIAPLIRLTEGEQNAPASVRAERFGLHVLYGVIAAMVADELTSECRRDAAGRS
ncbi:MAG: hypothetical protein JOY71_13785 [Acetobacteraceae bacterium]|nr:hypothetical protein [Acetobacteraceae bacterium]